MKVVRPIFFPHTRAFRQWLRAHHAKKKELWVGFHAKGSGRPSMTWPEAVDEALCYGWIDGIRKSYGPGRYVNRFTPRKPTSTWSAINIAKVKKLRALGLMRAAGERAFALRHASRTRRYSFEQRAEPRFSTVQKSRFRAVSKAWEFFERQPPSYRKAVTWWVISAQQEATRDSRLTRLIAASRMQRRL